MEAFTRWIIRRAGWVATLSLLLAAASSVFTVELYKNLRTDMEELLPKSARSVQDLDRVTGRLESTTNLAVLVFSKDVAASRRFVDDFAREIEASRSPLVTRVEYRIDEELRFFGRRKALFAEVADLRRVRDYVRDRIEYEREIRNPLNLFEVFGGPGGRAPPKEPRLDLKGLEGKYASRIEAFTHFKDGYYATRDESVRAVLIYLSGKAGGIGNALKLRALADGVVARLRPAAYAADLEVKYTGDVENMVEEHASLIADLELSAVIVTVLVTLAMMLFFRDVAATAALVASLLVGTLLTFGVAYFLVGYLNANSAFLGSIVIGNGINFGIIVLARYLEELRAARPGGGEGAARFEAALPIATSRTTKATLMAALAAGLSYGSLMLTGFRGFRQFGMIGMIGMLLCWATAFTTLPAFLALIGRWRGRRGVARPSRPRARGRAAEALAAVVRRAPRGILAVSALLVALAGFTTYRYYGVLRGDILETDMTQLRDRKSMTEGSGALSAHLDRIFERYTSPVVLLAPTRRDTRRIAESIRRAKEADGPRSVIAGVMTIDDFVPRRQADKIALLREIRAMLGPRLLRQMSPADRALARSFLTPEAFRPFGVADLPKQVKRRFRENDGSLGKLVLVEPVLDPGVLKDAAYQAGFIRKLRAAADLVDPPAPVVGQLPVTVDMYQSVRRDGPRATAFALGSVALLAVLIFREATAVVFVLASLLAGVAWLMGTIFGWSLKINFLNFIALPITFGIGVDYAVNVLQRYRLDGKGSVLDVLRSTGGAVALASLTTMIGYGSLLIAGNQGFVSFGRLAILGELTCLAAALVSLPAYLHWRDSKPSVEVAARGQEPSAGKGAREKRAA